MDVIVEGVYLWEFLKRKFVWRGRDTFKAPRPPKTGTAFLKMPQLPRVSRHPRRR